MFWIVLQKTLIQMDRRFLHFSKLSIIGFLSFGITGSGAKLFAQGVMQGLESETQAIVERAKDSVVQIKTIVPLTDAQSGREIAEGLSAGTGFFIDGEGSILTAASVVRGREKAVVYWRNQTYEAQSLGQDDRTNLALLKIDTKTPTLTLGDPETLKVGSLVLAVGYPYDGPLSAEYGSVSDPNVIQLQNFFTKSNIRSSVPHIRSSVRVQPGQSGSPLLNSKGEVVGMVVYAMDDGSSTFVLPITAIRRIQQDLAQFHAPRYGWTGVTIEAQMNNLKSADKEISIRGVYHGYPGDLAGIQPGDVLKRIGNREIRTPADVMNATFYLGVGETVNFTVEREGEVMTLPVKVVPRPTDEEMVKLKLQPSPVSR